MRLLRLSVTFPQPFLRPGGVDSNWGKMFGGTPNTTDKQEKAPTYRAGAAYTVAARRPLSENYRSNSYTVVNRANGY